MPDTPDSVEDALAQVRKEAGMMAWQEDGPGAPSLLLGEHINRVMAAAHVLMLECFDLGWYAGDGEYDELRAKLGVRNA